MNSFQIEAWTIKVIENVLGGRPNEDALVELKSEWPSPADCARQLAGHANAARGESILWIIGVDQRKRIVTGVAHQELANWSEKIRSLFSEGIAPTFKDLNINFEGNTIVALLFETDRFPYVFKHSNEVHEIPWREGTSTRSANRSDLFKLLGPLQLLPNLEVLFAEAKIYKQANVENYIGFAFHFYITPNSESTVVIPFHKCKLDINIDQESINIQKFRIIPPHTGAWSYYSTSAKSGSLSVTIEAGPDEVVVHKPGKLIIEDSKTMDKAPDISFNQSISINLSLLPVNAQIPAVLQFELRQLDISNAPSGSTQTLLHHWIFP